MTDDILASGHATDVEPVPVSPLRDGIVDANWWHSLYEEHLAGPFGSREDAVAAGLENYCGEPFYVLQGDRFKYQAPHFDIERIAEDFDDENAEYGPEDEGPSSTWSGKHCQELERKLTATMDTWLDRHGYRAAHAIDVRISERIDPEAKA